MGYSDELKAQWNKQLSDQGIQGLDALRAFKNQSIANQTAWNLFGSTDKASAERWFAESDAGRALQEAEQSDAAAKANEARIQQSAADYQKSLATQTANIAEGANAQARRQYAAQKSDVNKQAQARGALYSGQRASQLAGLRGGYSAQAGANQAQAAQTAQSNLQNLQSSAASAALARRQLASGKFEDALNLQRQAAGLEQQQQNTIGGAVGSALGFGAGVFGRGGRS